MTTTTKQLSDKIKHLLPCKDAITWTNSQPSIKSAWKNCKRGDWMLWILKKLSGKPESNSRKKLVLTTCECARLSLKFVKKGELRPLKAIEAAEKWARNEDSITIKDVRTAATAAYAAAAAADAAADADTDAYAAYAAAYAAAAADADADAAAYAAADADAAAYAAADAYAYAAYAADAARKKVLSQCANIVRKHYPILPKINKG